MSGDILILAPILFPIIAAVLLGCISGINKREHISMYMMGAVVINGILTATVLINKGVHLEVLTLGKGLDIYFKVDEIAILFAGLVSIMWILVGIYTIEYFKKQENYRRYVVVYILALGVLIALSFAGNLITLYVFFEAMTLTTMPFVLHENTVRSTRAAFKYMFYSIAGAMMSFMGIVYVYNYANTLKFIPGGVLDSAAADHKNLLLIMLMFMLVGFGAKAGMFPLHSWLHEAHPVAPAPASALLSGVIVKCGVLAIIRVVYNIYGISFIAGTWVQYTWIILILITIFMGSMLAYREKLLKKRLAYSTISQISYILLGLACFNTYAFVGGVMHTLYHAMVKIVLFLVAGAIIYKTGKTRVDELEGIGKRMPITMTCYTIVSLALIGIPPTNAFLSKWFLVLGSLKSGIPVIDILGVIVLLVSALLTAGYLLPLSIKGFFPGKKVVEGEVVEAEEYKKDDANAYMLVPIIIITVGIVALGIYAKPIMDFILSIIENVL